jgi:hypothetical protein
MKARVLCRELLLPEFQMLRHDYRLIGWPF